MVGRSRQGFLCQGNHHAAALYQGAVLHDHPYGCSGLLIANKALVRRRLPGTPLRACPRCPWVGRSIG